MVLSWLVKSRGVGWGWDTLVQNMQKKVLSHPTQFFHLVEKDGSSYKQ